MQAIRKVIKVENGIITLRIPEIFGENVEVVVLPLKNEIDKHSLVLMKAQEETGFVKEVLSQESEEIWNDV